MAGTEDRWEHAFLRFETPEQEARKFIQRLRALGADRWDRDLAILEIFCGRGGGLVAWERLGFRNLSGLDRSARLLAEYSGPAKRIASDARSMPLPDRSQDVVSVQGGLHHLETLEDLEKVMSEIWRVLRPGGRLLVVEPWLTPFLRLVHLACRIRPARLLSQRLDALATMIELEQPLYSRWLASPREILAIIDKHLARERITIRAGKLYLLASRRAD
jgi:SAM-dependent methyltransferase